MGLATGERDRQVRETTLGWHGQSDWQKITELNKGIEETTGPNWN